MKSPKNNSPSASRGRDSRLGTLPQDVPPHPNHNRKEITSCVVVVVVSAAACYGLSRFPQWQTLGLYLLGLGPLLGLLALSLCRTVRCPRCRTSMDMERSTEIVGRQWIVFHCERCGGSWRIEEECPPPG